MIDSQKTSNSNMEHFAEEEGYIYSKSHKTSVMGSIQENGQIYGRGTERSGVANETYKADTETEVANPVNDLKFGSISSGTTQYFSQSPTTLENAYIRETDRNPNRGRSNIAISVIERCDFSGWNSSAIMSFMREVDEFIDNG